MTPAPPPATTPQLIGVDFSSSPTRRKPITLASGSLRGAVLQLGAPQRFDTLAAFGAWLAAPGDWVGGFDLPFGLPRELVEALGWPTDWLACMRHYAAMGRAEIRERALKDEVSLLAEARKEGREEGIFHGLLQGIGAMLHRKFGEAGSSLAQEAAELHDVNTLQDMMLVIMQATTPEQIKDYLASQKKSLGN